jgi:hypothetical protein
MPIAANIRQSMPCASAALIITDFAAKARFNACKRSAVAASCVPLP